MNSFNVRKKIASVFSDEDEKSTNLRKKVSASYGGSKNEDNNPFLNRDGELRNPSLNFGKLLENPNISDRTKRNIAKATGMSLPEEAAQTEGGSVAFNANANADNLGAMDVTSELPKLNTSQISRIIAQHFPNSTVITPSDAQGIYDAQQKSGMSALAILGIGALESGYGTSNIAKQKNNIWGWNATNVNPGGNATTFSQMSEGAKQFADAYLKTYYNGYGAKSINSAGTGNNPSGKGYAYHDNGSIDSSWATKVSSIMKNFYNTAKSVFSGKK